MKYRQYGVGLEYSLWMESLYGIPPHLQFRQPKSNLAFLKIRVKHFFRTRPYVLLARLVRLVLEHFRHSTSCRGPGSAGHARCYASAGRTFLRTASATGWPGWSRISSASAFR